MWFWRYNLIRTSVCVATAAILLSGPVVNCAAIEAQPATMPVNALKLPDEANLSRQHRVSQLLSAARKLKQIGDFQGALDHLNELRILDGQNQEAEEIRQEIAKQFIFVRNEAERQRQADSFLRRGWQLECEGKLSSALAWYNIVRAMYPTRQDAQVCSERVYRALEIQTDLALAHERERAGNLLGTIDALNDIQRLDPEFPDAIQMRKRVEEKIRIHGRVMSLMTDAATMEAQGDLRSAMRNYDEVTALDAAFTQAGSKKAADAQRIQQTVTARVHEAKNAEARSNYAAALKSLESLEVYGPDSQVTSLHVKIEGELMAVLDRRDADLRALLARAQNLADEGDPQKAIGLLESSSDHRASAMRADLGEQMALAERRCDAGDNELAQSHFPKAVETYRLAICGGSVRAMVHLSDLYRQGKGVATDLREAETWLERAAKLGNVEAMEKLGMLVEDRDPSQAITWFERAAPHRSGVLRPLGELYQKRDDLDKALEYFRQAADLNKDATAMFRAAQILEGKDHLTAARTLYENAGKLGNIDAKNWLKEHPKHLINSPQ